MSRQPIVSRALIVAGVGLAVAILARFGVAVPPDLREAVEAFAIVAAPLAVAYWSRRHTTPVESPRDADGRPLAPARPGR